MTTCPSRADLEFSHRLDNLQSDFCGDEGLQEGILLFHKIIMDKLKVPLAGRLAPQGP